ncbi:MAG: hypothetical protein IKG42_05435 [Clostridia bacterium]|nr:hypothetical protein [Clostridia bacterium]
MKKYKILIVSDHETTGVKDDLYIARSFKNDGHLVRVFKNSYQASFDEKFDVIIRRYDWPENILVSGYYGNKNENLKARIYRRRKVVGINLFGFQETDYSFFETFTREKIPNVIPSVVRQGAVPHILRLYDTDRFIIREKYQYLAKQNKALHVMINQIPKYFEKDVHMIQPDLKYKSEVQFHFVGNKLLYAFEYTPNKYSSLAKEKLLDISPEDREVAERFAKISNMKYGMQRIDFIRLTNGELMLSEIRDTNVDMRLEKLDPHLREKVINEFKKNIYEFLELDLEEQQRFVYYDRYYYPA